MKLVKIDSIIISPNRQRKEFNAETELMESIQSKGLFHPIVVRHFNDKIILVAGERRLRAIKDIWALGGALKFNEVMLEEGLIPTVDLGDLSPLDAEEAELEENIRRIDLTWQEKAQATSRLVKLRTAQAIENRAPLPSIGDIYEEIHTERGNKLYANSLIRNELLVASHLHKPEVANAKTIQDAFKILKLEDAREQNRRLADKVGKTFSSDQHELLLGHFDRQDIKDNLYDVILTDPPYGMDADLFADAGGKATPNHSYTDDIKSWHVLMRQFSSFSFRVAKEQAHLYAFCDIENFFLLHDYLAFAGWTVFRTPLIWYKPNGNRAPWPQHGPQRKYECILYAIRGKKTTLKLGPDVLMHTSDANLGLSAQKPVDLYIDLLKRSARAGDLVLDPFCGTGTIFPAAQACLCTATGIELDPANYGIAIKRLEGLKK